MAKKPDMAVGLTVAGSDSGGGAGIQADLKTFSALGVFGTTAITCVTSQSPKGVTGIQTIDPELVSKQIRTVHDAFEIRAIKTGMLFSPGIISTVAATLQELQLHNIIVDPVMVASSGAKLLKEEAVDTLKKHLLPICSLVTPNLHEASHLLNMEVDSVESMHLAARELFDTFGCRALVKGGHLPKARQAIDVYFDGKDAYEFKKRIVQNVNSHGSGCTFASAIAAHVARGKPILKAVELAKHFVQECFENALTLGDGRYLNHFWRRS
jgi:hydroxymethylpyrimidine/phosphomethylpyrimidine kinase